MFKLEFVRKYCGEKFYEINIAGLKRKLPIVNVGNGIWIASNANLVLGDVEFINAVGKELAIKIKPYNPEIIVTPEAKSLALAYEVARNLGHKKYIVARKSVKAYMKNYLVEEVKSITTREPQKLVLSSDDIALIKGKRICLLDDVVSTGGTIRALERLVVKACGNIVCRASIWLEGPWCRDMPLIYLSILPIFVKNLEEFRA